MNSNPKIIVFEPNWIGDVIFTTPIFKAIKEHEEGCFLGCIVPKRCRNILENNPFIDEIIEFNERTTHNSFLKKISFVRKLKSKHYETALILHRSFTRTLVCYLAGIRKRVGYAYEKRAFLLTDKIPPVNKDSIHKQDYYLGVAEEFGIKINDRNCRIYCSRQDKEWADKLIGNAASKDILIAINPTTNWPPKNWPLESFIELINILITKIRHIRIFITSKEKIRLFQSINTEALMKIVNLSGKTSIAQVSALYEKMDVVVSGDSGPLHISGAVNTKYVGIFGPTNPQLTAPKTKAKGKILFKNTFCPTPCYIEKCPKDFICMKTISPHQVADAVMDLVNS